MVEYRLLFGKGDRDHGGACCDRTTIYLDIFIMLKRAKKMDITFENYFTQCISHELMHLLLDDIIGFAYSRELDNICSEKTIDFKRWHGGIAW